MTIRDRLMEQSVVYRLWQAPFAERKLSPLFRHNDLRTTHRVLDVGCGPGTNTRHFQHADYLGIDINSAYIESARRRYGRRFVVADVTSYHVPESERFDFILVNSFLHHLDTNDVLRLLNHLSLLLAVGGHIHVFELVMPTSPSAARLLARWDRGDFARMLCDWHSLLGKAFSTVVFEPYALSLFGLTLWNMVYFKGGRL